MLIRELLEGYRARRFTPVEVVQDVLERIETAPQRNVWITRLPPDQVMQYARALLSRSPDELPLYGIPFAIKDNIDLAGVPTTAACPDFAYVPERSATVVQKLIDAGAIPVGKTNLDQFATGLVGTRSPYGACQNSFSNEYISGGSSSGSAVAVATGLVSFALGTDTAGSGRVPAAFNNVVGLKPSCGLLSTTGVVPACRSLDCISILALSAADAASVLEVVQGFDIDDSYSRDLASVQSRRARPHQPIIGIPRRQQLEFFGDAQYARLFTESCERMSLLGSRVVEIDFTPLFETARLLYEGAWVAERYAAIEAFLNTHSPSLHPVTAAIIGAGRTATAVSVFRAQYRLKELQRAAAELWREIDALLVPSAGTIYRIADVLADPVTLNSNLGRYTNFVNLLDLAAIAVPAGFRADGLPFGVTLIAPAGCDDWLLEMGGDFHHASVSKIGALDHPVPAPIKRQRSLAAGEIAVAVCGAHMSGLPLNHQLTDRGARLLRASRTAPTYRFFALSGGPPQRPGLIRDKSGAAIDVEVWAIPQQHFGSFVAGIPSPLGIGKLELEEGTWCSGFLCEAWAIEGAHEITALGGWRRYLHEQGTAKP